MLLHHIIVQNTKWAMSKEKKYFAVNQEHWNRRVSIHQNSAFYDVEGFRNGNSTLNAVEREEVGSVDGKSMLHLQCHFGLDSMSWARAGAEVAGVDFSEDAIDLARELNRDAKTNTDFICCNVYDLKEKLNRDFDIVFTSYGVVGWLPDLDRWAEVVCRFVKRGGIFYMAEFHPVVWMFDEGFSKLSYSYFNRGVIEIEQSSTYADRDASFEGTEYSWNHPLGDVVNALISHGLKVEFVHEYDYSPYNCFPDMVEREKGKFYLKDYEGILPMMYSIKARKP
jgi:SAM-dependent methyltransferase